MPTNKKRINLTIPDAIYERLQNYKEQNGIVNDASACLQLITQQLNAQESMGQIARFIQANSLDKLSEMSVEGMKQVKNAVDPADN